MQTPDDTGARLSRRHRLAGALVGAVWLAMLVNALRFVAVYGSELPIEDDLEVPDILRNGGLSWSFLWSQHNEHRNPISRLIQFGLYRLTGDIRSGMYFEVLLLALLALAMIVAARRLRGHASWTDLVFALLWMHTGNSENLLMGHQISLMLPITLVGLVIVAFALHPRGLQARTAVLCVLAVACLPLCGGPGWTQAPAFALALALCGWMQWKSGLLRERRAAWILWSGTLLTLALCAVYLVGLTKPAVQAHSNSLFETSSRTMQMIAFATGMGGWSFWPWSGWIVGLIVASGAWLLVRTLVGVSAERLRAATLGCALLASVCIALGIGYGRGGDGSDAFAVRYVGLTTPILCSTYFAWLLYGGRLARGMVLGLFCVAQTLSFAFSDFVKGEDFGHEHHKDTVGALEDLQAGIAPHLFVERNRFIDLEQPRLWTNYHSYAGRRIVPFDRLSPAALAAWDLPMFRPRALNWDLHAIPIRGSFDEVEDALLLPPESTFTMNAWGEAGHIVATYGVPRSFWDRPDPGRVRVEIVLDNHRDKRLVLLDRLLDPAHMAADRGTQHLELDLPGGKRGELEIRVLSPKEAETKRAWVWWSELTVR